MKNINTLIRILVITLFLGQSLQAQTCIDHEGNYNFNNWKPFNATVAKVTDVPHKNYLQLTDEENGSFAINYDDFSGNWITKGFGQCLSFDYMATYNAEVGMPTAKSPLLWLYQGAPIGYNGSQATFGVHYLRAWLIPNPSFPIIANGVWKTWSLPVGLSSGGQLPSNSFGQWEIVNENGKLTGSAACTAWDNLIQNVTGFALATDYNSQASEKINFDNFCWQCKTADGQIVDNGNPKDEEGTWDSNTPKDCFCCDKAYNLPTKPQIAGLEKVECGTSAQYSTSNCPGATTTWAVSPSLPFSGQGTTNITFNSIPAGSYTLSLTISCGKKRYTSTKIITALAPQNCSPSFLTSIVQMPNGLFNISAVPTTTAGTEHYWSIDYNGSYPNCIIPAAPILLNNIVNGSVLAGTHVTSAGVLSLIGTGATAGTTPPYSFFYGGIPNNSCFKITHYVKCCGVWLRQTQSFPLGTSNARMVNGATPKPDITIGAIEIVK
ncbi:hypothetical protein [Flavobacterium sp. LB3R33]|uniref:hypothetical protein n=1 Tax=Flavobacterium sp. LB3R33 TaxID=3401721 RepID=UPI003AAB1FB1